MSQGALESIGIHPEYLLEHKKMQVFGLKNFCDLHAVQNGTAEIRLTVDEFPNIQDGQSIGIGTIEPSFDGCNSLIITDEVANCEKICHDRTLFSSFKEGDQVMLIRKGNGFEVKMMNVVKPLETISTPTRTRFFSILSQVRSILI